MLLGFDCHQRNLNGLKLTSMIPLKCIPTSAGFACVVCLTQLMKMLMISSLW